MVTVVEQAPAKRCVCHNCKSVLEYRWTDITSDFIRDYGGGGDTYYRIVCPVCNRKNNVERWSEF